MASVSENSIKKNRGINRNINIKLENTITASKPKIFMIPTIINYNQPCASCQILFVYDGSVKISFRACTNCAYHKLANHKYTTAITSRTNSVGKYLQSVFAAYP